MKNNSALDETSIVLLEQLRTIDKQRIIEFLGRVSKNDMLGIDKALIRSLSLNYLIKFKLFNKNIS